MKLMKELSYWICTIAYLIEDAKIGKKGERKRDLKMGLWTIQAEGISGNSLLLRNYFLKKQLWREKEETH